MGAKEQVETAVAKTDAEIAALETKVENAQAAVTAEAVRKVEEGEATEKEGEKWLEEQFARIEKAALEIETKLSNKLEARLQAIEKLLTEKTSANLPEKNLPEKPPEKPAEKPAETKPAESASGVAVAPTSGESRRRRVVLL